MQRFVLISHHKVYTLIIKLKKRSVMKKMIVIICLAVFLISCTDKEDTYVDNSIVSVATVENPENLNNFYLILDNNERLYISVSDLKYYRPKDGQRIIAKYKILSSPRADESTYKHGIQLLDSYEILTKDIYRIKPEEQDSIGNDRINVRGLWIGNNFLNVEFDYPGNNRSHSINLVFDSLRNDTDGKIHLEFRHNANGDYPSYSKWGIVSFRLNTLDVSSFTDSVKLVIHSNEFNKPDNQTYELTYRFENLTPYGLKQLVFKKPIDILK